LKNWESAMKGEKCATKRGGGWRIKAKGVLMECRGLVLKEADGNRPKGLLRSRGNQPH